MRSLPSSRPSVSTASSPSDWRRRASAALSGTLGRSSSLTSLAMPCASVTRSPAAATSRAGAPVRSLLATTACASRSICGLTRVTSRRIPPSDCSSRSWFTIAFTALSDSDQTSASVRMSGIRSSGTGRSSPLPLASRPSARFMASRPSFSCPNASGSPASACEAALATRCDWVNASPICWNQRDASVAWRESSQRKKNATSTDTRSVGSQTSIWRRNDMAPTIGMRNRSRAFGVAARAGSSSSACAARCGAPSAGREAGARTGSGCSSGSRSSMIAVSGPMAA